MSEKQTASVLSRALKLGDLVGDEDTAVIFYDLSFLKNRIRNLVDLFPSSSLHAIAIKANPLTRILQAMCRQGVGAEAATLPELYLAVHAGFPPHKIVFDSPAKTAQEIAYAIELGAHVNAESFLDLDRIAGVVENTEKHPTKGSIGVRINPQVGVGSIASTSVAGEYSKFGIPLDEYRDELTERFERHTWLCGVHIHIGSQGCSLELLLRGIEKMMEFVHQVNARHSEREGNPKIDIVDIGGGLPVSYKQDIEPISMARYRQKIEEQFPELFTGDFKLITEFGRYIHANCGWVASRVENVKRSGEIKTAMIHVGADLFIRECYNPHDWYHKISVLDGRGRIKARGNKQKYTIAGPLCFAGDIIAREVELPEIEIGDFIIIHDTGAYTLSMWSRYNSRQIPKVVGYYNDGEKFEILRERESIKMILDFWS